MFQFFVESSQKQNNIIEITGPDVNHIKNVIRLKTGDRIRVSVQQTGNYFCTIDEISSERVKAEIMEEDSQGTELSGNICLLQGLAKGEKMEFIIQKAVELGVNEIVPVRMQRSVVKWDEKKEKTRVERWQAIVEAAAKQSKRSCIPQVLPVMNYKDAIEYAKTSSEIRLLAYENQKGMEDSQNQIKQIQPESRVCVLIGPEGGFSQDEIEITKDFFHPISLGRRILRTETAAICLLSLIMYQMERD